VQKLSLNGVHAQHRKRAIEEPPEVNSSMKDKTMFLHSFPMLKELGLISNSKGLSPSSIQEVPKETSKGAIEGVIT